MRTVALIVFTVVLVFAAGRATQAGWTGDVLALAGVCFALLMLIVATLFTRRRKPADQAEVNIHGGTRVPFDIY